MIFEETELSGCFKVHLERITDDRGFFARGWCQREFEQRGLDARLVQTNTSFNLRAGTLRGMHFQVEPAAETKLVRCIRGAIYDVVLDLRQGSPTFKRWTAVALSGENRMALYIPTGLAHGFQTLEDNSEVFYQMSEFFAPQYARGVKWNDPAFAIEWPPCDARIISAKDEAYPPFAAEAL